FWIIFCSNKPSSLVDIISHEALDHLLVSLVIRHANERLINWENGFGVTIRCFCFLVFSQDQNVPQPTGHLTKRLKLVLRSPSIRSCTQRFFEAIIHIPTNGTYLRFAFKSSHQRAFIGDGEV